MRVSRKVKKEEVDSVKMKLRQILYHTMQADSELDIKCNDNIIRKEVYKIVREILDEYNEKRTVNKDKLKELINVLDDAINKVESLYSEIPDCRTYYVRWEYGKASKIASELI